MTEISLNCLPVGMTSVGKNVYPVVNTLDESDDKGNDVTTENFEGVDPCVLTGYREMDGSTNEQEEVEDLEASAQDFNLAHEELGFQDELGFLYLPINLRAIFDG